ncbi:MAG: hypothetical protein HY904_06635 [Deltaproteobacteria bacterium]|nr:hypothetical protein [Deltaproteobacteria bacterium]
MSTVLLLVSVLASQAPTPAPTGAAPTAPAAPAPSAAPTVQTKRSVLVLPLTLDEGTSDDVARVAETVERGLARAIERQGTTTVVRSREIRERIGEAAAKQMTGCDELSCLAELAGSLGVDRILQTRLRMRPGVWELRVSVLDRLKADVTLRRELSARSVDALLASLDTLAREVAGGTALVADDPKLAERLGTDAEGADRLRKALAGGAANPVQAWTDEVIRANAESEGLAMAEGALIGVGGAAVLATFPLFVVAAVLSSYSTMGSAPPWAGGQMGTHDTYTFPVLLVVAQIVSMGTLLAGVPFIAAGVLLLVVDRLDLGRIRVAREGCCRDEPRIRAAAKPGWGRRAAPIVAVVGGAMGLFVPLVGFLGTTVIALIATPLYAAGAIPIIATPGPAVDEGTWGALYIALMVVSGLSTLGLLGLGATAAALGTILTVSEYSPLVDAE